MKQFEDVVSGGEPLPGGSLRMVEEEMFNGSWSCNSWMPLSWGYSPTTEIYRSKNGKYYFEFIFEDKGDYFDAHIVDQPSYGVRDSNLHSTHRMRSDLHRCTHLIDFADSKCVPTLEKVRKFTESWCEYTVKYIDHGIRF